MGSGSLLSRCYLLGLGLVGLRAPRDSPRELNADSPYDSKHVRAYLRSRGKANITVNPRNRSKPKHGRPYKLNLEDYRRMRCSVKRFFAWLKREFRRLAMRYERLTTTFIALIQLACVIIHLRFLK
jgi:transposase